MWVDLVTFTLKDSVSQILVLHIDPPSLAVTVFHFELLEVSMPLFTL